MIQQLLNKIKIDVVIAPQTSGGTEVEGTILDMQGYEGVIFVNYLGTPNAGNYLQAKQGNQSNMGDAQTLAGSKVTSGASDEAQVLEIFQPSDRYVRPSVIRAGTNTTVGLCIAIRYGAMVEPRSSIVAGAMQVVQLVVPAEGTP
ncbi:MAG TPA: hypothetical protein VK176_08345 [Phycisphaerales bacterium]|nr:hypothetical protein [Phycisphaerales bacterium]